MHIYYIFWKVIELDLQTNISISLSSLFSKKFTALSRNRHAFILTKFKINTFLHSFKVFSVKLWNALPRNLQLNKEGRCVTVNLSKSRLRHYLLIELSVIGDRVFREAVWSSDFLAYVSVWVVGWVGVLVCWKKYEYFHSHFIIIFMRFGNAALCDLFSR